MNQTDPYQDARLGAVEARVSSLSSTLDSQASSISAQDPRLSSLEAAMESLLSTTTFQANTISVQDARLSALEAKVVSLSSNIASQAGTISALQLAVQSARSENQFELMAATSKISALEASLSTLSMQLAQIKSTVSAALGDIRGALLDLEWARLRREDGNLIEAETQLNKFLVRISDLERLQELQSVR